MCNVLEEFNLLVYTKGRGKQSVNIYFLYNALLCSSVLKQNT